jgi:tryptophan-rich sensory protein
MKGKDILIFLGSVILCQGAGVVGSLFTTPRIPTWYAALAKPDFTPPDGVFAPVWITLFFLMGVSLFLVVRDGWEEKDVRIGVGLFILQLVLNVTWSALFFGLTLPLAAFVEIVFLWIAILLTTVWFFRVSKVAGLLLVPYLLWVGFAAVLNLSIAILNA